MTDETKSYTLTEAVVRKIRDHKTSEVREDVIETVEMRRPRARDLRATDGHEGDVAKAIALIAHLTGLTVKEVDGLNTADFKALGAMTQSFSAPGRSTGETSSET